MLRFKSRIVSGEPLPPTTWPDWPDRVPGIRYVPLFAPRPALRKLRVMIDVSILERAAARDADDVDDLLVGLLHHRLVSLLRYRDGGPPASDVEKGSSNMPGAVEGWVIGPERVPPSETTGRLRVLFSEGGQGCMTGFNVSALRVAEADNEHNPYDELSTDDAALQRALDVAAARSAGATGMDLFVSERPYLHEAQWEAGGDVVIAKPTDALPFVSLYLRAQDHFSVRQAHSCKPGSNINLTRARST